MKKPISLVLLICILLSCVSLCACSLQVIIDKIMPTTAAEPKDEPWQSFEGVIETTVTDSNGNEITISHTDNFTEDDIEFVARFQGCIKRENNLEVDKPSPPALEYVLNCANDGHPILMMQFDNPYIICAYSKLNSLPYVYDEQGYYEFDVQKYVWYKYNTQEDIPEAIEDNKLTDFSYLLYDCNIKKDISNNISYNKNCKFYIEYVSKGSIDLISENMLIYYFRYNEVLGDSKFISYSEDDSCRILELFTDENGEEYLKFQYARFLIDGTKQEEYSQWDLGHYYSVFQQYYRFYEEDNYFFKINDNNEYYITYFRLYLEDVTSVLFQ